MRYGSGHKAKSRERIVMAAAERMRDRGAHEVAVADVMARAGLTHGGFYAHFDSKAALLAEATSAMFADTRGRAGSLADLATAPDQDLKDALAAWLAGYLSPRHRDRPGRGCPLPALAGEIARTDDRARENFKAGMTEMIARLEAVLARLPRTRPGKEAEAVVAQMVGAVALARALGPGEHSDAMLGNCLHDITTRLEL